MTWSMTAQGTTVPPPPKRDRSLLRSTDQQEAFWSELLNGSGHTLLEARAGTGKSYSCREGLHRLLEKDSRLATRYCCFNKKIAEEFRADCPEQTEVGTMHSFGLRTLAQATGAKIDRDKTYLIIDSLEGGTTLKRYIRKAISNVVSLAKNHALDPAKMNDAAMVIAVRGLIWHYDINTWGRQGLVENWTVDVLRKSAEMTGLADFDDMLWLPVIHELRFPSLDFLFIDEVQDLNAVQHAMVPLMARGGRTIIVGDPHQAIYAFRGADSDSIPNLRRQLDAKVMPLTKTFRCPKSHVRLAQALVPDFESGPDNPEGIVEHSTEEIIDEEAGPGEMVLCRTNAPIIGACLRALASRRKAVVRGRAIGEQLGSIARSIEAATTADLLRGISRWRADHIAALEDQDGAEDKIEQIQDRAAALDAIASSCSGPTEVPKVIANLFSDDNPADRITFSSVHRAKGSEASRVYYLQIPFSVKRDRERPPQPWELQQRRNLEYVAKTRSRDYLALVSPNTGD